MDNPKMKNLNPWKKLFACYYKHFFENFVSG